MRGSRINLNSWSAAVLMSFSVILTGCDKSNAVQVVAAQNIALEKTFAIHYRDDLPAPLNDDALALGAKQASKVLVLTRTDKNTQDDLGQAVSVAITFDKTLVPKNSVPIVVCWDGPSIGYSPVSIRSIDWSLGTLTFTTTHASQYVVLILDQIANLK